MKYDIVILSPHLDDAVLSLGEHILRWKRSNKKIHIVNIFSVFQGKKLPKYTREYLHASGENDVSSFAKKRTTEDKKALEQLNVTWQNLNLIDGGFRLFENEIIYKTSNELFSGKISPLDNNLSNEITLKLQSLISSDSAIYLPYGIGKHADHLLVRKCAELLFKKPYYYADMPYALSKSNWNPSQSLFFIKNLYSAQLSSQQKKKILNCYNSQISILFKRYPTVFPELVAKG
jgi:LmbE family N-acetylglucosaminyl deacetylase